MAGLAGDDPIDFDYFFGGAEFRYDPFDGDNGEEFCVSGFSFPDGDDVDNGEVLCVSGLAFLDGDDNDNLLVEHQASQASHEEPILETLGRSFDSDDGLSMYLPQLVSALDLAEDPSEEEVAGDDGDAQEFILGGLDREPGLVIGDDVDDDGDDGLGFMLSGFDLDPRPVTGGFQTLVDADDGLDAIAGHGDMDEETEADLRLPAFRMLVEDIDSDDSGLLDALLFRTGEAGAQSRRLPASRKAVQALPEVVPSEEEASSGCAVCKDGIAAGQLVVRLPCKHFFHGDCIRPWLAIRNTCPVCRYELPTGDADYDRQRRIAAGVTPTQHGTMAQSGTVGAEDATECAAENRFEQSAS